MAERASTPKPNFAEKNLAKTHSPVVSRTHPHVSCDLDQLLHSAPGIEQGRLVWRRGRLAVDAQFGLIIGFDLDHIFIGYMIAGIPFLGYFSVGRLAGWQQLRWRQTRYHPVIIHYRSFKVCVTRRNGLKPALAFLLEPRSDEKNPYRTSSHHSRAIPVTTALPRNSFAEAKLVGIPVAEKACSRAPSKATVDRATQVRVLRLADTAPPTT